ncbi:metalloregulator ArsR/SmtB family transcription factor [Fictibacillus sp. WQ 8-8]|uniref:ArsR/SmtB family transcription factor n=1 Tax=Fictibacillus sp. WQ 8-8 TaxID=2938788 RepID=UPI00210AB24F|nr:metalloregulator ArsR/SmtB family transcription factor [Fictibacillus sp. WQ 8-8]MCQ6268871.1 metalloregulator ArsR/SmtB family transcription factor [Fictibacillus sp. WQ 8-8]
MYYISLNDDLTIGFREVVMISEELHRFLKALASEKRQEIVFLFMERREITVNEVSELVKIGQSTASEQLAILKRGGLLSSRKEGKEVIYFPNRDNVQTLLQTLKDVLSNCC